jgi:hypothetical protein
MKRHLAFCLLAAAASLAAAPVLRAEEQPPPRGYRYFTPARGSGTTYRYRPVSDIQTTRHQPVELSQRAAPAFSAPLPPVGQQVVLRPVSWGSRLAVAYVYPTAAYGQYGQTPGQPAPESQVMGGNSSSYPAGINPYKYAYPPGGGAGYSYAPVYSSGYYTSGCYQANACCRCCRRRCTLFGGMAYGCSPGCYTSIPAPCPTACAYGGMISPPAYGTPTPVPSAAPTTPPPTPAPGTDDGAPPQPIEKKVTPVPQANLFPRIPGLPPDA